MTKRQGTAIYYIHTPLNPFNAESGSQGPQPSSLEDGWVHNTQKNMGILLRTLPELSFGHALGKGDKNWISECLRRRR